MALLRTRSSPSSELRSLRSLVQRRGDTLILMNKTSKMSGVGPPVGALVKLRLGSSEVVATVVEDRGPIGVGGRHLWRVKFLLEGAAEAAETEVPLEEMSVVALPDDPAPKRVNVEGVGDAWVGTYTAPDGRVAVVTDEMATAEEARTAALRWVRRGLVEAHTKSAGSSESAYTWEPDPRHPGRYSVFRQGRLGPVLDRAHA